MNTRNNYLQNEDKPTWERSGDLYDAANMLQSLNSNLSLCYSKANALSTLIGFRFVSLFLPLPTAANAVLPDISYLW